MAGELRKYQYREWFGDGEDPHTVAEPHEDKDFFYKKNIACRCEVS